MVVRVELIQHHIARLELPELVWSCPHRLQVIRRIAGILPLVRAEQVLGQDQAPSAKEGAVPEGNWLFEHYLDGRVVELVDLLDVRVGTRRGRARGGIRRKLPGKDHV